MCQAADIFPVIEIESGAYSVEFLGTKEKFWIFRDGQFSLVKFPRPGTGEHWAEKVAAHLAEQLGLPHAKYDLARVGSRPATISPNFVPEGGTLIHGNELLKELVAGYDEVERFRQSAHTLQAVFSAVKTFTRHEGAGDGPGGVGTFIGYLMLDALIGNTDRHHENWGVLQFPYESNVRYELAPSYDHASSLGCHELPSRLEQRLDGPDARMNVDRYCDRARSAFYGHKEDTRALPTLDALRLAADYDSAAAPLWLDRLNRITPAFIDTLLARMPEDFMSEVNRRFARAMISYNRSRLAALYEEIV